MSNLLQDDEEFDRLDGNSSEEDCNNRSASSKERMIGRSHVDICDASNSGEVWSKSLGLKTALKLLKTAYQNSRLHMPKSGKIDITGWIWWSWTGLG